MSATETKVTTKPLHLPSLAIKGFRGINKLSISRLGRVTLLAGKNGVGKTTVLEAVRLYAARGRYGVLGNILRNREELTYNDDEDGRQTPPPNWDALFFGRDISSDALISIGPVSNNSKSSVEIGTFLEGEVGQQGSLFPEFYPDPDGDMRMLRVRFHGRQRSVPMLRPENYPISGLRHRPRLDEDEFPPQIPCASLGPSVLTNQIMAGFWDEVALTDHEDRGVQALQFMFGDTVQRVAMIGNDRRGLYVRRAVVKLKGHDGRVPLKSLGDGAVRIFGVALALANSGDGFLVIDEAENGIHYSVQRDYWKMILKTAHENNVQVLATTHSWDCVVGFAQAAMELKEIDAAHVRLQRELGQIRAVEYSESDLAVAARQGIEVR